MCIEWTCERVLELRKVHARRDGPSVWTKPHSSAYQFCLGNALEQWKRARLRPFFMPPDPYKLDRDEYGSSSEMILVEAIDRRARGFWWWSRCCQKFVDEGMSFSGAHSRQLPSIVQDMLPPHDTT